jgi:hypothetical protein
MGLNTPATVLIFLPARNKQQPLKPAAAFVPSNLQRATFTRNVPSAPLLTFPPSFAQLSQKPSLLVTFDP